MQTTQLFTAALNLQDPWYVKDVSFEDTLGGKELHIRIDFKKGGQFVCPEDGCKTSATAFDTQEKTWRHLNFFQYKAYIHARVPRIKCPDHKIRTVEVPWARPGSGFTLLFEAMLVEFAKVMAVSSIADLIDEHDTRVWRVIRHYVDKAREIDDLSSVTQIGVDETSKKGHNYITIFADLAARRVISVQNGKNNECVTNFIKEFSEHDGNPDNVEYVTCDMSLGFQKGIRENLPKARPIIDRFHIVKHANEAVDEVRREECKENSILKNTRYLWLKNDSRLSSSQLANRSKLCRMNLKTARAFRMRLALQDIYACAGSKEEAEDLFAKLIQWMRRSRLEPMKKLASMLTNNMENILHYWDCNLTNGLLEGLNSVIQNIKNRARGFKNVEFFKTMIFLVAGGLDLDSVVCKQN
jgi:transposase